MKRLILFKDALAACGEFRSRFPDVPTIGSIERQLQYLICLETGQCTDRTRLKNIVIGILTVREIEPLDPAFAEMLYQVSAEARRMLDRIELDALSS